LEKFSRVLDVKKEDNGSKQTMHSSNYLYVVTCRCMVLSLFCLDWTHHYFVVYQSAEPLASCKSKTQHKMKRNKREKDKEIGEQDKKAYASRRQHKDHRLSDKNPAFKFIETKGSRKYD